MVFRTREKVTARVQTPDGDPSSDTEPWPPGSAASAGLIPEQQTRKPLPGPQEPASLGPHQAVWDEVELPTQSLQSDLIKAAPTGRW